MFSYCANLKRFIALKATFAKCTKVGSYLSNGMLSNNPKLEEIYMPEATFDNMEDNYFSAFVNDSSLRELDLPKASFKGVTQMYRTFYNCTSLETISLPRWDLSTATAMNEVFARCKSLKNIPYGLPGLKVSVILSNCPLTHESALAIINTIATITDDSAPTVTFSTTTYNTLTADEIKIATDKGWKVLSA
jgi:surface protein